MHPPHRGGLSTEEDDDDSVSSSPEEQNLHPNRLRCERARTDKNAHEQAATRTTASSLSLPKKDESQYDSSNYHFYSRLKSWNDGRRDPDRQAFELEQDVRDWIDTYAAKLDFPAHIPEGAQQRLAGFDLRKLGAYNSVHKAALASLVVEYSHHFMRQRYREADNPYAKPWASRDDILRLSEGLGMSESDLRSAISVVRQKTSIQ